jgi:hypothetical protein
MKQILFSAFIFLFLIFGTNVYAQTDSTISTASTGVDSSFSFPLILKTTPLSLIDFTNGGSAVLIAESFPVKNFSVSMEIGTYYPLAGYGMKHLHGWRSGFELRYYFNEKYNLDYFLSLNYFTKKIGFSKTDSIKIDLTEGSYSRNYLIHKDVSKIDLEFGKRKFTPGKKFVYEYYVGLGVRFKNTTCSDLTSLEADHRLYGDSLFAPALMECGNFVHFDFLFGLKIGFGVKKRQ